MPALAHRLVLRPELWVQRVSSEDVVREVLETVSDAARRGRRRGATRVTRTASPRLLGYAALAAVGLVAALALRRPELAIVAAPFALLLAIGTRVAREPTASRSTSTWRTSERSRAPWSTLSWPS